jgi:hypothetical protein
MVSFSYSISFWLFVWMTFLLVVECAMLLSSSVYVWWNWMQLHWVNIGWLLLFPFDILPFLLEGRVLLCLLWPR